MIDGQCKFSHSIMNGSTTNHTSFVATISPISTRQHINQHVRHNPHYSKEKICLPYVAIKQ